MLDITAFFELVMSGICYLVLLDQF